MLADAPTPDRAVGIVVTYQPDEGLPARIAILARQVGHVVVVDNASDAACRATLTELDSLGNVDVIRNPTNRGIATALNQGIHWARKRSKRWVLLADQDTELAPDAMSTLQAVWRAYADRERLAVIGGNFLDRNARRHRYEPVATESSSYVEQTAVITAGSLLSVDAAEQIGMMRDEFFIDHVDHEYCLRARRSGFAIVASRRPIMQHTVGAGSVHARLGLVTYNHSPRRWYYMLRNEVTLIREYLFREPRWVLITFVSRIRITFFMLLFERQRGEKLRHALRGVRDGIAGRFETSPLSTAG